MKNPLSDRLMKRLKEPVNTSPVAKKKAKPKPVEKEDVYDECQRCGKGLKGSEKTNGTCKVCDGEEPEEEME